MPPASPALGLAHITDVHGRLLMPKGADGGWRLPGGPALPEESARNAMTYHVRRDLRLRVEPRFLLGVEPVPGTASTAYLFACETLDADDIARIRLPEGAARSTVVALAFVDYPGLTEGVSPHEHRLIAEAGAALLRRARPDRPASAGGSQD
ncbi:NUDIX hydrolase [Streptomyces huiliensis]|uniref:NUDIX hydrolase n=1 Tax=Streptomyces huiliensis TaxID=2876027 RepID=UPI001CBD63C2|nr:NUDIX hydrolase [Streptomyces huiliensis]MBZ4319036.1 NUDIX hydrolase [Streptomyces huiliensis]